MRKRHVSDAIEGGLRSFASPERSRHRLATSAITQAEVWFGYAWKDTGLRRSLDAELFFHSIQILDWPASAAPIYGRLRARLTKSGVDIGLKDVVIAAHALALDAILVTNNTRHFSRISPPLQMENWLA